MTSYVTIDMLKNSKILGFCSITQKFCFILHQMQTALINKQIQAGDINGSFERALSAGDLSLVMAACRAADPDHVFAVPCKLEQYVLLSLIQQLATDMLHETQLKCRSVHNYDKDSSLIIYRHVCLI